MNLSVYEFEKKIIKGTQIVIKTPNFDQELEVHSSEFNVDNLTAGISVKIVSASAEFDTLKNDWNNLCDNSAAHIFQTYEWQRLWWKHYGQNKELFIILFYRSEKLVGIAPFFIDDYSVMGVKLLRRLRLIGSCTSNKITIKSGLEYGVSDYLDIIIMKGYEKIVTKKLLHILKEHANIFNIVEFDEAAEDSNLLKLVLPEFKVLNWNYKIAKKEICPKIITPNSISDFMSNLNKKIRHKFRKIDRDLINNPVFEIKTVRSTCELENQYEAFVALHQRRWNAKGLPGVFVDKRFESFLHDLLSVLLENEWLHFSSVYAEGDCLAVDCSFKYKNYYYDYLKAFDDQSSYAKYRPGQALQLKLIEDAINNKAYAVDLLRGNESYKFEIANEWQWVHKITANNPVKGWGFRYHLFRAISKYFALMNHIGNEFRVANVQLSNHGLKSFTYNYLPMTLRKLKKKYFVSDPVLKIERKDKSIDPKSDSNSVKKFVNQMY